MPDIIPTAPAPVAAAPAAPVIPVVPVAPVTDAPKVPNPLPTFAPPAKPEKATSIADVLGGSDEDWAKELNLGKKPESPPAVAAPVVPAPAPDPAGAPVSEPAAPTTDGEFFQGADEKWRRPNGEFASADEIAAITDTLNPGAPPVPDVPKVPTVKPQGYKALDHEGKELAEVPDIRVTYTANGKVRENVPIDQLVRHVQNATYSTELQEEAIASRQTIATERQEKEQIQSALQQVTQYAQRLLTDEAFLVSAINAAAEQNTPEARVRALQEENEALRTGQSARREVESARPAVLEIAQSVETLSTQYPDISQDEMLGRFNRLTSHLLVDGKLPPQRLQDVQRLVATDLAHWAQATHESRAESKAKVTSEATTRVNAAQVNAALAKRQLARGITPKAGAVPALRESPTSKAYKSTDDVLADIGNIVAAGLSAA